MVLTDESIVARATELMEAELGDELVALDVEQGKCFGLNAPAASVWRLLQEPRSLLALRTSLQEEYAVSDQDLRADLQFLLEEMNDKGLVSIR